MKSKFALTILLAASAAIASTWHCNDIDKGVTAQQTMDQVFDKFIADPDTSLSMRAVLRAQRTNFDALCVLDTDLGTSEASQFIDEALNRHR
jgi:hypothetical protein